MTKVQLYENVLTSKSLETIRVGDLLKLGKTSGEIWVRLGRWDEIKGIMNRITLLKSIDVPVCFEVSSSFDNIYELLALRRKTGGMIGILPGEGEDWFRIIGNTLNYLFTVDIASLPWIFPVSQGLFSLIQGEQEKGFSATIPWYVFHYGNDTLAMTEYIRNMIVSQVGEEGLEAMRSEFEDGKKYFEEIRENGNSNHLSKAHELL